MTEGTSTQQANAQTLQTSAPNNLQNYPGGPTYCPHCGRCPYCGRPYNYQPYYSPYYEPYYPPQPYPPYYPYINSPYIITAGSLAVGPINSGVVGEGSHA